MTAKPDDREGTGGDGPTDPNPVVAYPLHPLLADGISAFAEFAVDLNFSAAASRLHISQPALHAKITKLAQALNLTLYINDRNVLTLTTEGERVATYAHDTIRLAEEMLSDLTDGRDRTMTIAAGRGSYLYVLSKVMKPLTRRPGGIRMITAQNAEAIQAIRRGVADVATIAGLEPPPDLLARELASFPLIVVVRRTHRLAGRSSVKLADLDGLHMALPERGVRLRDDLAARFRATGIHVTVEAETLNWDLLVRFVEYGIESTIVNGFMALPRGIVGIPITDLPPVTYHAIWRPERQTQASELFSFFPGE